MPVMQVYRFYCRLNMYILWCQLTCLLCMYIIITYLAGYGNTHWFPKYYRNRDRLNKFIILQSSLFSLS